jgi:hypothetical protein
MLKEIEMTETLGFDIMNRMLAGCLGVLESSAHDEVRPKSLRDASLPRTRRPERTTGC